MKRKITFIKLFFIFYFFIGSLFLTAKIAFSIDKNACANFKYKYDFKNNKPLTHISEAIKVCGESIVIKNRKYGEKEYIFIIKGMRKIFIVNNEGFITGQSRSYPQSFTTDYICKLATKGTFFQKPFSIKEMEILFWKKLKSQMVKSQILWV